MLLQQGTEQWEAPDLLGFPGWGLVDHTGMGRQEGLQRTQFSGDGRGELWVLRQHAWTKADSHWSGWPWTSLLLSLSLRFFTKRNLNIWFFLNPTRLHPMALGLRDGGASTFLVLWSWQPSMGRKGGIPREWNWLAQGHIIPDNNINTIITILPYL